MPRTPLSVCSYTCHTFYLLAKGFHIVFLSVQDVSYHLCLAFIMTSFEQRLCLSHYSILHDAVVKNSYFY